MTNLTTEEMQRIVDGAPEGATHYDDAGYYYTQSNHPCAPWQIYGYQKEWKDCHETSDIEGCHNLNDLRTILAQQQEIEELKEELSTAIEIIEDSGIDYNEVVEAKGESDE